MKKALIAGLITLCPLLCAHASEVLLTEARIWQTRAEIEVQAERIRRTQEIIENRAGLSNARIETQLALAEEDLLMQQEKLETLRDQLVEQLKELDRVVLEIKADWKNLLNDSLEQVSAQILENNALIIRLRTLKDRAAVGEPSSGADKSVAPSTTHPDTCRPETNCSSTTRVFTQPDLTWSTSPPTVPPVSLASTQPQRPSPGSEGATPTPGVPPPALVLPTTATG